MSTTPEMRPATVHLHLCTRASDGDRRYVARPSPHDRATPNHNDDPPHWQPQPPPAVVSPPQHVGFSLLSQHVDCLSVEQQAGVAVEAGVSAGPSAPVERNSVVLMERLLDRLRARTPPKTMQRPDGRSRTCSGGSDTVAYEPANPWPATTQPTRSRRTTSTPDRGSTCPADPHHEHAPGARRPQQTAMDRSSGYQLQDFILRGPVVNSSLVAGLDGRRRGGRRRNGCAPSGPGPEGWLQPSVNRRSAAAITPFGGYWPLSRHLPPSDGDCQGDG
jgi:hypothetical protein